MASYERQTWVDLQTPLDAAHMNHIEEGIASIVGITSIKQTTTSTADGGNNVITATLDNGTTETFNIKNGSKGSTGSKGDTGAAGVGIKSVVQTTTSSADGGNNVITVTKTDGTTSTFVVKNGSKGSTGAAGAKGADGYTPVKGVDYWTPADQESIVQQVIAALGTPVFGTIDENNHITLSGHLVGGTYTLSFEDEDGFEADVGTIDKSSAIVNLIDTVGYQDGKRVNSSGEYVDADGYTSSGRISVTQGDVLRTKGINFDAADNSRCNIHVWEASGANQYFILNSTSDLPKDTNHLNITIDDNNNLTVTIKSTAFVEITFTGHGSGKDLIVTKNQEIG